MQNETGAVFQPELIELMKTVLDDAARCIPEGNRTSAMKAEIASQIHFCSRYCFKFSVLLSSVATSRWRSARN